MYLVVEWTTISAPERERLLEIRRRKRVVDDDELLAGAEATQSRAMSTSLSSGLVGVSIQKSFVFGRDRGAHRVEVAHVDVGKREAVALEHAREEPVGSAVEIVADDDVVARGEQIEHRRGRRHAAGKGASRSAPLRARRAGVPARGASD